jgi:isoleucyl-tRNA synthetase
VPRVDIRQTLNLPSTDFPMKANLPRLETRILQKWEQMGIYQKIWEAREGAPKFILHDGPPYANGDVHVGTGINKVLKDIVIKYKTMKGFFCPYVPGWDCHGLPIEHKIMVDLGSSYRTKSISEIRKLCREFAQRYVEIQRRQFKSLGVFGDWENPYLTFSPEYEVSVIEVLEQIWANGYLYRRKKPIHWCINCRTALAEAELEYKSLESPSIYLRFGITSDLTYLTKTIRAKPAEIIVWTTTPWTLPANQAVALHPEQDYALVEYKEDIDAQARVAILGADLVDKLFRLFEIRFFRIVKIVKGKDLAKITYHHPLFDKTGIVVLANYVKTDEGTGSVHIAPGHGEEDYQTGVEYGLEVMSPVNEEGRFTSEAEWLAGLLVFDADPVICEKLKNRGVLILQETLSHSYPCCWRCKKPVIFRATEQWFVSIDHRNARKRALEEIDKVKWVPEWGKNRIYNMVKERPDWCISRQRYWGVPIPVFYCKNCGAVLMNRETFAYAKELIKKEGADGWYKHEPSKILPPDIKCPQCQGSEFRKENDILDVWFESASSHRAVSYKHPQLRFPADVYLEGHDQHRGWFQVSLWASLLSLGKAPYKTVITHGFVVDALSREKVSKSAFLIPTDEIRQRVGAELYRIWVASTDYVDDLPFCWDVLDERKDQYRKFRNTFRYMLANLYDFDPQKDAVTYRKLRLIDKWALSSLQKLIKEVEKNYENYQIHKVYLKILNFCNVNLSSLYFDIVKDRLYVLKKDSAARRSAQTVLYHMLITLTKLLAPILVFTTEEVWENIKWQKERESIHLTQFPKAQKKFVDEQMEESFNLVWKIRTEINKEIERLRLEEDVGSSLEVGVEIYSSDKETQEVLKKYEKDLPEIIKVSHLEVKDDEPEKSAESHYMKGLFIYAYKLGYLKCERCWNYHKSVGKSKDYPTLCTRCVSIIKQIGVKPE